MMSFGLASDELQMHVRLSVLETSTQQAALPLDDAYSTFWAEDASKAAVPIVRLYGRMRSGDEQAEPCRVAVHIHGVFPYLYVPFQGGSADDARAFAAALEAALQDTATATSTASARRKRRVHSAVIVQRTPIYGYHETPATFLQVKFRQTGAVSVAAQILLTTPRVLGRPWQPHEAHVPFHLQFLTDNSLVGMGVVALDKAFVRHADPDVVLPRACTPWPATHTPPPRAARAAVEVDVRVTDIRLATDNVRSSASPADIARASQRVVPTLRAVWDGLAALGPLPLPPPSPERDPDLVDRGREIDALRRIWEEESSKTLVANDEGNETHNAPLPALTPEAPSPSLFGSADRRMADDLAWLARASAGTEHGDAIDAWAVATQDDDSPAADAAAAVRLTQSTPSGRLHARSPSQGAREAEAWRALEAVRAAEEAVEGDEILASLVQVNETPLDDGEPDDHSPSPSPSISPSLPVFPGGTPRRLAEEAEFAVDDDDEFIPESDDDIDAEFQRIDEDNEDDLRATLPPPISARRSCILRPSAHPPSADELLALPMDADAAATHVEPFYSNPSDVPAAPLVYAGREHRVVSHAANHLRPFEGSAEPIALADVVAASVRVSHVGGMYVLTPAAPAPLVSDLIEEQNGVTTSTPFSSAGGLSAQAAVSQDRVENAAEAADARFRPASPKYDESHGTYLAAMHAEENAAEMAAKAKAVTMAEQAKADDVDGGLAKKARRDTGVAPNGRTRPSDISVVTPPGTMTTSALQSPASSRGKFGMRRRTGMTTTSSMSGVAASDMRVLSVEIHALTRGKLLANPKHDAVCCIAVAELADPDCASRTEAYDVALFLLANLPDAAALGLPQNFDARCFATEAQLILAFVDFIQTMDPDVLVAFEMQQGSIGYLSDRLEALQVASAPSEPLPQNVVQQQQQQRQQQPQPQPQPKPAVRDMDPAELAQKLRDQQRVWEEEQARIRVEEERKRRESEERRAAAGGNNDASDAVVEETPLPTPLGENDGNRISTSMELPRLPLSLLLGCLLPKQDATQRRQMPHVPRMPNDFDDDMPALGDSDLMPPPQPRIENNAAAAAVYAEQHGTDMRLPGRVVISLWRILRSEVKLGIYSRESCAREILQTSVPYFHPSILTSWMEAGSDEAAGGGGVGTRARGIALCARHVARHSILNLRMIETLDLVGRTAELARVFGIDFFSVLSRGSQFRVESMMLRLAHTRGYIGVSPSKEQVYAQPAMEIQPLILEPESKLYTSPVLVLDFQSLYPSMVIAHNLCFSTMLGKCTRRSQVTPPNFSRGSPSLRRPLGAYAMDAPLGAIAGLLNLAEDGAKCIAPNGAAFVPKSEREGVLPRLLQEILETRVAVKQVLKRSDDRALRRILNARQFALKLVANVTYGYTAAGFSGRMPMAELADAIVSFGRETLERAIQLVERNQHRWGGEQGARVVYGDTDSMFVHLPGKTREQAFAIGAEIADMVTATNPAPVTMEFEKVYHPCLLLTKKRYVGFAYESPNDEKPVFDAKGIETVRRDGCPAVSKLLERTLRVLFSTRDLSAVKLAVQQQASSLLAGRFSLSDYVFRKEVRLGTYAGQAGGALQLSHQLPPAAIVAIKAMRDDPRREPRYGERVRYVVVNGEPGSRLIDVVVEPAEFLKGRGKLRLNATYYWERQIVPALERCFGVCGAPVMQWYKEVVRHGSSTGSLDALARRQAVGTLLYEVGGGRGGGGTIEAFYASTACPCCGQPAGAQRRICSSCASDAPRSAMRVLTEESRQERRVAALYGLCLHCGGAGSGAGGGSGEVVCTNLDCEAYFARTRASDAADGAGRVARSVLATW